MKVNANKPTSLKGTTILSPTPSYFLLSMLKLTQLAISSAIQDTSFIPFLNDMEMCIPDHKQLSCPKLNFFISC